MSKPLSGKETVDALANEWAKLLAVYMHRESIGEIVLTCGDIRSIQDDKDEPIIVVQELHDGLHIQLLPFSEAKKFFGT